MDQPVRVLHVDDEPGFAELVSEFLERESDDITVLTDASATEAMERLTAEDVDCVVSDYDMPGTNGIEFLEAVREDYPNLPFVLFTGKGSEEVASDALSAGATDYLQKGGGTDQYAILANRVRNAVEQRRSKRRAASLERLRNLAAAANRELVRASSRRDAEQCVVDAISSAEPYRFAWIGEVDEDADRIHPRVAANDDGYLDDVVVTVTGGQGTQGPAGEAVLERHVAVSQDIDADAAFDPWREQVRERGVRSTAAAPIAYEDDLYGVLVVYATEAGVFDDAEQQLLAELAADVGHAIHAHEVRRDLALHTRAMDEAPVGITITDPDREDNSVVYANDAFTDITGYERAEMLGRNHRILQGPDSDPDAVAEMRDAVAAGRPVSVELWNYRADGSRFWNRVSIAPVHGDDGEVEHFVGFQEDLTTHEERKRELEESRDRFEALFDDPNILVGLLDTDGRLREVNDTAMAYLDADREDVVGEPFWETPWWSAAAAEDLRAWVSRAAEGEYVKYETEHEQSGNGSFVVEGAIRPVTDDSGDVQSLVVSARDVTDRVQRERILERQNERFDELASAVSHDLQTPLSTALGRAELALETGEDDHLEKVIAAIERANDLRSDLVDTLRMREIVRDREQVSVGDAARDVWATITTADTEALTVQGEPTVSGDEGSVRRLLENLLSNSVEHAGSDVSVSVGELADGFSVEDDGPGIPPEHRDEVFTAGFSTKSDGSGIGMASVREIVVAHDWTIEIADSDAGGVRFEVRTGDE